MKNGTVLPLKRQALNDAHAAAMAVCIRAEGIQLIQADGTVTGTQPVLAGDRIEFFRVATG